MNRREMIRTSGLGVAGFTFGTGFTAPACDKVSKDKAVRYAGFIINYLTDMQPLLSQLGGATISQLIDRAIPLMEKLKTALEKSEIPSAQNFFDTATNVLSQIATALLNLPASARRDVVMGILTAVNVTMRTVRLFVESESPTTAAISPAAAGSYRPSSTAEAMRKAFEATRF